MGILKYISCKESHKWETNYKNRRLLFTSVELQHSALAYRGVALLYCVRRLGRKFLFSGAVRLYDFAADPVLGV
jgi:hypothetical protein